MFKIRKPKSKRCENHPPRVENNFRRNRTIVGSTSNGLNSVNVVKTGLESPRTHIHHLTIMRRKVLNIFLIILLSGAFLWLLVSNFTASPQIVFSDVSINKQAEKNRYSKIIQDYLQANPMERFSFMLSRDKLTGYMSSKLPEVEEATLQGMQNIGKTNFIVKMRKPIASWNIDETKYYVDSMGVSFKINYFSEPSVQIIDNSGVPLNTGQKSVSKRFLGFVGRVVSQARSSGYNITTAVLPANTTRELDVSIKDKKPLVKLSIDRPVGEQIEDMSRALQYFETQNMVPEYIDIRVDGKAYYK